MLLGRLGFMDIYYIMFKRYKKGEIRLFFLEKVDSHSSHIVGRDSHIVGRRRGNSHIVGRDSNSPRRQQDLRSQPTEDRQ